MSRPRRERAALAFAVPRADYAVAIISTVRPTGVLFLFCAQFKGVFIAPSRYVLYRFAPSRFASPRFASFRFAYLRFAFLRFACLRSALARSAASSFAPVRSAAHG